MKPLLIVKTGETLPGIAARRGDFEVWIARGLGLDSARLRVVCPHRDEALPAPREVSGVVVTGSASMVSDREPWSERTAEWLTGIVAEDRPLLAICYGHQLLAHALGGEVGPNPNGREIGTVDVQLAATEGDALLGDLPRRLRVQATHVESVISLPAAVERLGWSDADPNHVYRVGARTWGVQFHPEFDADIMRGYIDGRRPDIAAEGLDPDRLLDACADSAHGAAILGRFAQIVAEAAD